MDNRGIGMKKIDYIGKQFGRLTVIGEVPKEERQCKARVLICQCVCGKIVNVRAGNLSSGNSTSCGCFAKDNARKLYERPVINERFGRLVGKSTYYTEDGVRRAICICDCGNQHDVRVGDLFSGMTRSCGCLKSETSHNRTFQDITGQTFNELTAIKRVEDYVSPSGNHMTQWLFKCSCGQEIVAEVRNVKTGRTKSCGHIGKSYAEYQIFNYLIKHHIKFRFNGQLPELINPETKRPLFMDFIIYKPDNSYFVIEHQGEQHFYPVIRENGWEMGRQQREITDLLKKEYCIKNNIQLYETLYNENYMQHLKQILKENCLLNEEEDEDDGDDNNG